jgi:mono/diheme cytochrome c family protein
MTAARKRALPVVFGLASTLCLALIAGCEKSAVAPQELTPIVPPPGPATGAKPSAKPTIVRDLTGVPEKIPAGDAKAGKEVFASEGCIGCHKSKDYQERGGTDGPDLSKVAKDVSAREIYAYIKKPSAGSTMPAFAGPPKALNDVTAYLTTQK